MVGETRRTEKIWILGGKSLSADNNIPWQEDIPNLSNSDLLIIDLNTIPDIAVPRYEIRDYLRYMLMAAKTIYVILTPEAFDEMPFMEDTFPVFPAVIKIKPVDFKKINLLSGKKIPDEIVEYCKYVDYCPFFINGIDFTYLSNCLKPETKWAPETYYFTNEIASIRQEYLFEVLNVSYQSIGFAANYYILDRDDKVLETTGQISFLPPPNKITSEAAVEVLVNSLVGLELKEGEPDWASKIQMPRVAEIEKLLFKENEVIQEATKRIQKLELEKAKIDKHKKLLWTFDKPLELAVKDAFLVLGFGEIREGRSKELEDLVIDFKTTTEFVHGVMEVKGREKRTSMADMNQCDKWVKLYRLNENKKVKGIFLPSQFRRTENLDSKKRLSFEKNEIDFAHDFNICVLPTSELFKAVVYILKGNKLSRNEIEKKILEADPICKLLD